MNSRVSPVDGLALYAAEQRRREWLQASIEVTRSLLSVSGEDPLHAVARAANSIAGADLTLVVLPTPAGDQLMIEVAYGESTEDLVGIVVDARQSISGEVIRTGQPVLAVDVADRPNGVEQVRRKGPVVMVGPVMVVPLFGEQGARGALLIARRCGGEPFDHEDLELATSFANHAAVALELADARETQQRMSILEDRHRIAADLHDHVLQRLFAAGMTMQAMTASVDSPHLDRLEELITDTDATIAQIRAVIHELNDLRSF
ncbi:hypothetical protein GCM10009547_44560 [Sporichthya brevicatena]|uniref:GAF domain-containing protein n=1 Tax=Sporichthya brevicatena TaxID=171442 RepID=A0ABP3SIG8_9ACTN